MDMYAWSITLDYRKIITLINVTVVTTFFNGSLGYYEADLNYSHYRTFVYDYLTGNVSGVTGTGVVATMNFTAIYNGTARMSCYESQILNSGYSFLTILQRWLAILHL